MTPFTATGDASPGAAVSGAVAEDYNTGAASEQSMLSPTPVSESSEALPPDEGEGTNLTAQELLRLEQLKKAQLEG